VTDDTRAPDGVFLYGIVPADVETTETAAGVGDPPAGVTTVASGDIAALVSHVPLDRPLGRPDDLRAYQRLLDGTVAAAPVLPVRFGAVLTDEAAVEELLAAHEDEFRAALQQVDGRAEYIVRIRYAEQALLGEILADNAEAQRLRQEIDGRPEDATVPLRVRLGEVVSQAVEARRAADARAVVEELATLGEQHVVRPISHEFDLVNMALLVPDDRRPALEAAVRDIAERWSQRATVRLSGPLAPYDFVGALAGTT
jgi:Gas vesicle synthesis protein GvpL/GvpF